MARLVVLGGAESGVGAAVLAKVKGFDVFLSDSGQIKSEYAATLDKWGISYEQGGHSREKIFNMVNKNFWKKQNDLQNLMMNLVSSIFLTALQKTKLHT